MSSEKTAVISALFANGIIALMKFYGASVSGSASMWAEFKHSLGDWANGFFLLVGINQSSKEADSRFQFGHGKKAFFWTFIASIGMLAIGGALSIKGGIEKIMHPEPLESIGLNLWILGLSIIFESATLFKAMQSIILESYGRYTGISDLRNVFKALADAKPGTKFIFFEDSAALAGLFIALTAITVSHYSGHTVFDGVASVIIGLMLFAIGFFSAKENMNLIMGESADPELVCEVGDYTMGLPGVKDVHKVRSMVVGPAQYLFHILVEADPAMSLKELDEFEKNTALALKNQFQELTYLTISTNPNDQIEDWKAKKIELSKKI